MHPARAASGDQVEIGHAAPEERVSRAEIVVNVQPRQCALDNLGRAFTPLRDAATATL